MKEVCVNCKFYVRKGCSKHSPEWYKNTFHDALPIMTGCGDWESKYKKV